MEKQKPKTQDEARQYAIDWQAWVSEQNEIELCPKYGEAVLPDKNGKCSLCGLHEPKEPTLYQSDLNEWHAIFTELGRKFDLTEEFIENGII